MRQATHTYSLSSIFRKAWGIARHNAKHGGGSARIYIAAALRQAWALAKKSAADILASRARVQAAVEAIKASHSAEATAQRAADMAGFAQRCGMPQRSYRGAWR